MLEKIAVPLGMRILLATNNQHKVEEIAAILADLGPVNLLRLDDLGFPVPEPIEDGLTLEANAYIKARETFEATAVPTIADDTGLEVTALGGAPGVYSARWAGEQATYADNCARLLAELDGKDDRSARFRAVLCYTDAYRTLFAEGIVEGRIVESPRGAAGFGYDPLFEPTGAGLTFAEMDAAGKNRISHRGRALRELRAALLDVIGEGS